MQFWIIIGILFLHNVSIARVPLNNHKGNGIVYREILDDKSYLKSLRQEDISFLFHEAGQIRRYGNSGLKMNFKKFNTDEDYWAKLYPFSNYITVRIEEDVISQLTGSQIDEISKKLLNQLESYNHKFDGVLLNIEGKISLPKISLQSLINKINKRSFRVGVQIDLANLRGDTFKDWVPNFCVYTLTPNTPGSKTRIKPKLRIAAKLGRPFYLSVNFGEMLLNESDLGLSHNRMSKYFKHDSVRLIEEKNIHGNLWRKYVVKRNITLNTGKSFEKGAIIHSIEPSLNMISKSQEIAAEIPSFYFSGIIYNLRRIHPRYLLSKSIKKIEPKLDYKLDKTHRDWLLRLRISNDSLLGSSNGNEAAGLAVSTRGFKLQSVDVGEFDNLEINNDETDTRYVFSLSELNALKSSSEVTLRFKPTSETALNAKILATAWIRPFGSSKNHYYGGRVESTHPISAIHKVAKELYKTAPSEDQKLF